MISFKLPFKNLDEAVLVMENFHDFVLWLLLVTAFYVFSYIFFASAFVLTNPKPRKTSHIFHEVKLGIVAIVTCSVVSVPKKKKGKKKKKLQQFFFSSFFCFETVCRCLDLFY